MSHVLLAGASGFLGTHLREALAGRGHTVTALVRRPVRGPGESLWDPYTGTLDREVIETADVVVNLAGAPTLGNPHSQSWARALRESRVTTTRVLAEAIAASDRHPAFLAGNGISYYGDRRDEGDPVLDEQADSRGDALLTSVTREWQAAAQPAAVAGSRLCVLRTAPVMDRRSEPLKQLRLLFLAGLGGRLGDGQQRMPMISLRDWVGAVVHLAEHDDASGPFNLCCSRTPTNAEFTDALAAELHRPKFATVPRFALQLGAGRMAPELLGSLNVVPAALEKSGYVFHDPDVEAVLKAGLSEAD
ncbi:MAG TPA: TIGR01777 family protein [Nocardioides bacterium]|uniref:TIGR01777 family oxidoreductase n=1 Tax=uncultured Nocardioides sp. TaxID=198441 RepID=UPI000ED1199D|nr:TIGR01777 family oxidoreductase [uncultured Nocardioides sp.]HCB07932.1 TIGR01777 family protein [Nocardioides sp.]